MGLILRQLFDSESSTYTYLLADTESKEAVFIDTVFEQSARDSQLLDELGLKLKFILETHVHADHVTGASQLREKTHAKVAVGEGAKIACADLLLQEDEVLHFGRYSIRAISTPGHTDGCMSYFCEGHLFTGDALLIRGNGRTDFQQGSSKKLYQSITKKLYSFPDSTKVYPAHDYRGCGESTIGEEKKFNRRIPSTQTEEGFVAVMASLDLAPPKKIQEAVPRNLNCGK